MSEAARPGDVLADRYRLVDLLNESGNGRFWRAHDQVLDRHVALHCIAGDDERAAGLTEAARLSATVVDRRLLRVLDADEGDGTCYVVNEWGAGTSLDILVSNEGPLPPRRAAWIVSEVAASVAVAHAQRVAHGRLVPENVLIDHSGSVRVIGCCVDAALRGLAQGRITQDVTDLGGLLYFALTGRWAGPSTSEMPTAPRHQDRWLRPRQVRAGIPRVLDAICDQVLNPFAAAPASAAHNLHTASGLAAALQDYVGDPIGLAEAAPVNGVRSDGVLAVPGPRPDRSPAAVSADADTDEQAVAPEAPEPREDEPTLVAPVVTAVPGEPSGAVAPGSSRTGSPPESESPPDPGPPAGPAPVSDPGDQPTQAGMPIFDDDHDDVSWFSARTDPSPPPPPLEPHPERPLFAPEPPGGEPVRRPRPGVATDAPNQYWPWDTSTGTSTGSGVIPVAEPSGTDDDDVPGRSWFRLAVLVGASLLLLLAVVVAFNLGRGKTPLGAEPDPESSPSASRSDKPEPVQELAIAGTQDLDPQGGPEFEENSELVPLAADGDPTTSWPTLTYDQQFGPAGLKTGVGLVVDLGESTAVSEVDLTVVGSPTAVTYYLTEEPPTAVAELEELTSATLQGEQQRTTLEEPATGRYLVVWLTRLPAVEGGFRGAVAEVVVRG